MLIILLSSDESEFKSGGGGGGMMPSELDDVLFGLYTGEFGLYTGEFGAYTGIPTIVFTGIAPVSKVGGVFPEGTYGGEP